MLNVLIFSYYDDSYVDILKSKFDDVEFIVCKKREDIWKPLKDADVLVTISFDKEMLDNAPKLKWIQSVRAGVDAYPLEAINERNILLTNGKGVHKVHMAEYAIASMIMLARNFHLLFRNQIKNNWDRSIPQDEINGSILGIIGLGAIGQEIAKKAALMGMKVIGVKSKMEDVESVERVYTPDKMDEVFKQSDYIINLLPHTPETEKIIDNNYFNLMKSTACFLNMGRGRTVNEKDLIEALQNNRIRAMVSDVFYEEPLKEDSPLWSMENVFMTPHISGESKKYMHKVVEVFEHNLRVFMTNEGKMINQIDLNKGY